MINNHTKLIDKRDLIDQCVIFYVKIYNIND